MDLRERLASIQGRRVQPENVADSFASDQPQIRVPLSTRFQHLLAAHTGSPDSRSVSSDELARLLGGDFCSDGVVLIEDAIPLSQWHGSVGFDAIGRVSLQFLAGGHNPPQEQLLFIETMIDRH